MVVRDAFLDASRVAMRVVRVGENVYPTGGNVQLKRFVYFVGTGMYQWIASGKPQRCAVSRGSCDRTGRRYREQAGGAKLRPFGLHSSSRVRREAQP